MSFFDHKTNQNISVSIIIIALYFTTLSFSIGKVGWYSTPSSIMSRHSHLFGLVLSVKLLEKSCQMDEANVMLLLSARSTESLYIQESVATFLSVIQCLSPGAHLHLNSGNTQSTMSRGLSSPFLVRGNWSSNKRSARVMKIFTTTLCSRQSPFFQTKKIELDPGPVPPLHLRCRSGRVRWWSNPSVPTYGVDWRMVSGNIPGQTLSIWPLCNFNCSQLETRITSGILCILTRHMSHCHMPCSISISIYMLSYITLANQTNLGSTPTCSTAEEELWKETRRVMNTKGS